MGDRPYSLAKVFGGLQLNCIEARAKTAETNKEDMEGTKSVDFEGIDRTRQKQKAAKADDAEIPEYLWLEHLMDEGPTPWPERSRNLLPDAMNTFQKYLIRKWKTRLCAEFHKWFESEYRFRERRDKTVEWKNERYQWRSGGRTKYVMHYYMRVNADAGLDWEAGRDALIRAM
jgi:hypothetical protein